MTATLERSPRAPRLPPGDPYPSPSLNWKDPESPCLARYRRDPTSWEGPGRVDEASDDSWGLGVERYPAGSRAGEVPVLELMTQCVGYPQPQRVMGPGDPPDPGSLDDGQQVGRRDEKTEERRGRHRDFWNEARRWNDRLSDALRRLSVGRPGRGKEAERVKACGTKFAVYQCENCDDIAQGPKPRGKCNHRLCLFCSRRRRVAYAVKLTRELERIGGRASFVTLTVRNVARGKLRQAYRDLMRSWQRLRDRKLCRPWTGGWTARETTFSPRDLTWHPHIHAIVIGGFVPQAEIAAAWEEITGGSMIVDIREITEARGGANELAKYPAKFPPEVVEHAGLLDELLDAIQGARLIQPWGCAYHLDDEVEKEIEAEERVDDEPEEIGPCRTCGRVAWRKIGVESVARFRLHWDLQPIALESG